MKISLEIDTDSLEKDVYAELKRVMAFEMDSFVRQNVRRMVIEELDKLEKEPYEIFVKRINDVIDKNIWEHAHRAFRGFDGYETD